MTTVSEAVDALVSAADRLGFSIGFRPEPGLAADIVEFGPEIPDDLAELWSKAAPLDVELPLGPNDDLRLYRPADVWSNQVGYRWDGYDDARSLLPGWQTEWIVVGDMGGDPLIAHTEQSPTHISVAMHGTGTWTPRVIAASPISFLLALAAWLQVLDAFDGDSIDESNDLAPKAGFETALRAALALVVPSQCVDNLVTYIGL